MSQGLAREPIKGREQNPQVFQEAPAMPVNLRLVTLGPGDAADLLNRKHPNARLRPETVHAYGQAMREGRWILNGMPLIFSESRLLLDGAQRLAASVETDIPLRTFVAENVDDRAFHTIDQHRRRSFAGILRPRGVLNHHLLANLMIRLVRYDERAMTSPSSPLASWAQLAHILNTSAAHREAVSISLAMQDSPLPEPVRTMIIFMGYQVDRAVTDRMLNALHHPENYPLEEPGVLLRTEIERGRENAAAMPSTTKLIALSIKALNAMLRGQKPRMLAWAERLAGDRPAEEFPLLEGYAGLGPLSLAKSDAVTGTDGAALDDGYAWRTEIIDAAVARRYLTMNVAGRRPIATHVAALTRDMVAGRWVNNGQPVCFSRSGLLINGQHRLLAVIEANGRIEVPVIHGLPEEAHATYDTQPRRGIGADDTVGSFGDQALAIAMANLLWRFEYKTEAIRSKRASTTEIHEILNRYPRLLELRGFARRMVEYGRSSVMGYGAFVIERDDAQKAPAFLRALSTGADLPAGHPILTLRSTLQRLRRENASQAEQLNALLAGWRRYKSHLANAPAPRRPAPGDTRRAS